ncbi:MAG TPA: rhodanese-like domain-containing protein [Spirochaetia bacterium]|nr:rhodanese-like domain-containing protein [Spirochaetia bacterium]
MGACHRYRLGLATLLLIVVAGCASEPRASDYLTPSRLAQLVSEGSTSYLLLDVRTPGEFASGHIPTAVNVPVDRIREGMMSAAKDEIVIVYCASGARASIAEKALLGLGFTNVANFGAIGRWPGELTKGS